MSDELLVAELGGAGDLVIVGSEDDRTVEARLLAWSEVGTPATGGRYRVHRGAFRGVRAEEVALEAIGAHGSEPGVRLVGRGVRLDERDDGPYAAFRVSRTRDGDELLELVRDKVYRRVSIVGTPVDARAGDDGVIDVRRLDLLRVGVVERGAFASAELVNARRDPVMVETIETTAEAPAGIVARTDDNAGALEELRTDMLGRMARLEAAGGRPGAPSPLAAYSSLAGYIAAATDPDVAKLLAAALADQTTPNNAGVIPPAFIADVKGVIDATREAIAALGGPASLGDAGMQLEWPYYAGDLTTLVGKQTAEKTEITSVRVDLLPGTAPIETFAGGSDISLQLIRRSRPSYLEAYGRIMLAGWSLTTEKEFEGDLLAGGTGTVVYDSAAADPNGAVALAAFFEASSKVKSATGSPASVALAATDVFANLGSNPALKPPQYGTSNVPGVASAATLAINVSGLPVIEAPFLPAGSIIWTNRAAAAWHEDGPFIATAPDVAKLGENRAIWSMGATGVFVPAGVVKNTLVAGTRSSSKA